MTQMSAEWRYKSACGDLAQSEPILASAFIDKESPAFEIAERICRSCPVRLECLKDAAVDYRAVGLRGGYFFEEGAVSRSDAKKIREEELIYVHTTQRASYTHRNRQDAW